jgi:hypothetical protein
LATVALPWQACGWSSPGESATELAASEGLRLELAAELAAARTREAGLLEAAAGAHEEAAAARTAQVAQQPGPPSLDTGAACS